MRVLRHDDFRKHLRSGPKRLGLTTGEEQAWCRWYGAEAYAGRGVIVEWGAWLGSLTTSYCEGLVTNPCAPAGKKVAYVYDLFRWEEWCEDEVRETEHAGKLVIGESFADYFAKLHAPYAHLLEIRAADLTRCAWDGPAIELIVNDAVKTLEIGKNVFPRFLPSLIPGEGLIANQDYLWCTDSFLAVLLYLVRDCFEFEYAVPGSCMVIFRCRRTPEPSLASLPNTLAEIDPALFDEAFAWSRRTVRIPLPEVIDLGKAVTLWQAEHRDAAKRLVHEVRLAEKRGDLLYDFQLDVLGRWGYGELFT